MTLGIGLRDPRGKWKGLIARTALLQGDEKLRYQRKEVARSGGSVGEPISALLRIVSCFCMHRSVHPNKYVEFPALLSDIQASR